MTTPAPSATARRGQLALALQEAFTVAVRLRSNRQVAASADAFRQQIKGLLAGADRDARRLGYDGGDVRQAIYAFIAFLDESVLNSGQPMFAAWPQQPLQEEVFGDHIAGETFFRNLQDLLGRQDSEETADLLEVYLLCLLLGFRGRYATNPAGLHGIIANVQDKVARIRGGPPPPGPDAPLPGAETVPASRDAWLPRLAGATAAALILVIGLFVAFKLSLGAGVGGLRELTAGLLR
jgi:type VI secretion system protein ImpK